ncbi:hypothetical protein, secreted [gut metagenome]|uniref:Lipoprotein n=1 Tax=gut metagenome TaxID=749906 RepID=J9GLR7_9ZZZZ
MKVVIAGMLCCLLSVACTNKQKTDLPGENSVSSIEDVQKDSIGAIAQKNTNLRQDRESNEREHTVRQSGEWKTINRSGNKLLEYIVIQEDEAVKGLLIRYSDRFGKIQTLIYTYPEDIVNANHFCASLIIKDLNFDKQNDIVIPLGDYGNQGVQYYDGYLWNEKRNAYVPINYLKDIANPQLDQEEQCLFSSSRESAACYHYERFDYTDEGLVKTAELIQTYHHAGGKPTFTEKHHQKGKGMKMVHSSVSVHEISKYWLKIISE